MASNNDSGFATFTATAVAIAAYTRVKVDSAGLILVSGAAADSIGVAMEDIVASGTGTVKLWTSSGTFFCTASAAVAKGAALFSIAGGKVASAGVTGIPLVALDAAAADLDIIECARTI
jgi:hypothetical protein